MVQASAIIAFDKMVMPEPNSGCWLWMGNISWNGYGYFGHEDNGHRDRWAHRFAYKYFKGPIPRGLVIDHKCRVRSCVNPDHLQVITFRENILLGVSPMAQQAKQTHCRYGHPLSGDNLWLDPKRRERHCKRCHADREAKRRDKLRLIASYYGA